MNSGRGSGAVQGPLTFVKGGLDPSCHRIRPKYPFNTTKHETIQAHHRFASLTPIAAPLSLLVPAHADTETWSGTTNGTWDTSTANWLTDGSNNLFESADDALFTGTPTNSVTAATGLTIGAITLDGTFTGSVTISGSNTVSGATTVSGGTLNLNNATGLGTSAITVNIGGILNFGAGNATYANAVSGAGSASVIRRSASDTALQQLSSVAWLTERLAGRLFESTARLVGREG